VTTQLPLIVIIIIIITISFVFVYPSSHFGFLSLSFCRNHPHFFRFLSNSDFCFVQLVRKWSILTQFPSPALTPTHKSLVCVHNPGLFFYIYIYNFGLGSNSAFCPLEALQPVWLIPEVYCTIPRISNCSYSGRQVPLASTTHGSPLAARGGTMGRNGGQMMPVICTQGSLTCHKSATWDR
jgi:hypothetical protein